MSKRMGIKRPATVLRFEVEVPAENVRSVVDSAVSSSTYGCCYWADVAQTTHEKVRGELRIRERETKGTGRPSSFYFLDEDALQRGLRLMATKAPEKLARILKGEGDGTDGDVLIQLSVLGEVRYG